MPTNNLENTNVVIVGAWNLSILTPDWLKSEFPNLVTPGQEIPLELSMGAQQSIRFEINEMILKYCD